jgi:hypothetical protein
MDGRFDPEMVLREMVANKEKRVNVFTDVVRSILERKGDSRSDSFVVGYLASLLSGGTVDHADLLFPILSRLPTVLLWYGACAGLSSQNRVAGAYGGLGYRLLRDLTRDESLLSRPSADISFDEFAALARTRARSFELRQSGASWLLVELVPLVTALFRWPPKREIETQLQLSTETESPSPLTLETLERIAHLLDSAAELNSSLLAKIGGEKNAPASRKKPRGKRN